MMPSKKNTVGSQDTREDSVVFNLGELAQLERSRLEEETELRVRARVEAENDARLAREKAAADARRAEERGALESQLGRLDADVDRVRKQEELLARAHEALKRELDGLRSHQIALGERVLASPTDVGRTRVGLPIWMALAIALVSASVSGFTATRFASLNDEVGSMQTRARLVGARVDAVERRVLTAAAGEVGAPSASGADSSQGDARPTDASASTSTSTPAGSTGRPARPTAPTRPTTSQMDSLLDFEHCPANDPLCGSR